MNMLKNKIYGALYGFAIGDAMGATTEFMDSESIKKKYGKVTDIIGGGWLHLKPGEVTDDTQMMMCVMDALQRSEEVGSKEDYFYNLVGTNFVEWLNGRPKDVGNQCAEGIQYYSKNGKRKKMPEQAQGNGGLMRALPCALIGWSDLNLVQNSFTHDNEICRKSVLVYHRIIGIAIRKSERLRSIDVKHLQPTGCVVNTLYNVRYWNVVANSFEDAVLGAVNDGGDADTIGALTGGLAGAIYGYEAIPEHWIEKLNIDVKDKLNAFAEFCLSL